MTVFCGPAGTTVRGRRNSPGQRCRWPVPRASGNLAAHSLTSTPCLTPPPQLGEVDVFSIEWPGVVRRHDGAEFDLGLVGTRRRRPRHRREKILYLRRLPWDRELQERVPRL